MFILFLYKWLPQAEGAAPAGGYCLSPGAAGGRQIIYADNPLVPVGMVSVSRACPKNMRSESTSDLARNIGHIPNTRLQGRTHIALVALDRPAEQGLPRGVAGNNPTPQPLFRPARYRVVLICRQG